MIASAFLFFIQLVFCLAASQWSYEDQNSWADSCQGNFQSPVAIIKRKTVPSNFGDFAFSSQYFESQDATVANTGHSVEVKLENASLSFIGAGHSDVYNFVSFHFHWGSEHLVDTHRYQLEGHFVHYAQKYGSFDNALRYKDGLAVLAVFYNVTQRSNLAFDNLVAQISAISRKRNRPVKLSRRLIVSDFFPTDTTSFFRYNGSLTTPTCAEAVVWTLFVSPSYLSRSQLKTFSQILGEDNKVIRRNYRDAQCLNGRNVLYQG